MKKNKTFRSIIAAIVLLSTAVACDNSGSALTPEQVAENMCKSLMEQTEICVMTSDNTLVFDKTSEQIVYNSSRSLYMVSNMDNSTHYTLNIDGMILLNNIINVTYTSNNIEGLGSGTLSMTIVNIDSADKRYWLWDSESLIGFVVDLDI